MTVNVPDEKLKGLKIMLMGFLISVGSAVFLLWIFNFLVLGQILVVLGGVISFIGFGVQFSTYLEIKEEEQEKDPFKRKYIAEKNKEK